MGPDCRTLVFDRIRQSGPLTVAEYMTLALYAPGLGYYARAVQRSGRAGDFVTSVDIGPLFGRLLATWFCEMLDALPGGGPVDLVEAAAGNGRLTRDILDACSRHRPDLYGRVRATLVECSPAAREAAAVAVAPHRERVAGIVPALPPRIDGVLFANELLDAMPVHVVEMTREGLAEVYVDADGDRLVERRGVPSVPELAAYFARLGLALEPGGRAEVNLAALAWIREAAAALARGYLVLIDYGYEAPQLYAGSRATGTLRTYHRHLTDAPDPGHAAGPPWLAEPGQRDITSHVDLTSVRATAEAAGLQTLLDTDQSRFLLAAVERTGLAAELAAPDRQRDRLALKTLMVPEGLGTAFRVLVFGRHVPPLSRHRDGGIL